MQEGIFGIAAKQREKLQERGKNKGARRIPCHRIGFLSVLINWAITVVDGTEVASALTSLVYRRWQQWPAATTASHHKNKVEALDDGTSGQFNYSDAPGLLKWKTPPAVDVSSETLIHKSFIFSRYVQVLQELGRYLGLNLFFFFLEVDGSLMYILFILVWPSDKENHLIFPSLVSSDSEGLTYLEGT